MTIVDRLAFLAYHQGFGGGMVDWIARVFVFKRESAAAEARGTFG